MNVHLLAFAVGAIGRRKARALAFAVGLTAAVTLLAAVVFLTESLRAESERSHRVEPDLVVQRMTGGRPRTVELADEQLIASIPAVRSVTARVWGYLFLPAIEGNITVVAAAPNDALLHRTPSSIEPSPSTAHAVIAEGRHLRAGEHEVVMGAELARTLGVQPGDELRIADAQRTSHTLKLVGTFHSVLDTFTADVVMCDATDARALLGLSPGQATDLALTLSNENESSVVAREIASRMGSTRVIERHSLARVRHLAFGRRAGLVLAMSLPALLTLLVLAWDRATGFSASERKELAIARAVGWSTSDVLWAKLWETLIVACAATAAGLAFAYLWVFVFGAAGLRQALMGWSVVYPRTPLTPAVTLAQVLGITSAIVGPFAMVSVGAAWRAATRDPVDLLRA